MKIFELDLHIFIILSIIFLTTAYAGIDMAMLTTVPNFTTKEQALEWAISHRTEQYRRLVRDRIKELRQQAELTPKNHSHYDIEKAIKLMEQVGWLEEVLKIIKGVGAEIQILSIPIKK